MLIPKPKFSHKNPDFNYICIYIRMFGVCLCMRIWAKVSTENIQFYFKMVFLRPLRLSLSLSLAVSHAMEKPDSKSTSEQYLFSRSESILFQLQPQPIAYPMQCCARATRIYKSHVTDRQLFIFTRNVFEVQLGGKIVRKRQRQQQRQTERGRERDKQQEKNTELCGISNMGSSKAATAIAILVEQMQLQHVVQEKNYNKENQ